MTDKEIARLALAKLLESGIDENDIFIDDHPTVTPIEEGDGWWVRVDVFVNKTE